MKKHYDILGISQNASKIDIKNAYRKLSQKFHPDLNNQDEFYANLFTQINEAYTVLSNDDKRKIYDIQLNEYNKTSNKNNTLKSSIVYHNKELNDNLNEYLNCTENVTTYKNIIYIINDRSTRLDILLIGVISIITSSLLILSLFIIRSDYNKHSGNIEITRTDVNKPYKEFATIDSGFFTYMEVDKSQTLQKLIAKYNNSTKYRTQMNSIEIDSLRIWNNLKNDSIPSKFKYIYFKSNKLVEHRFSQEYVDSLKIDTIKIKEFYKWNNIDPKIKIIRNRFIYYKKN